MRACERTDNVTIIIMAGMEGESDMWMMGRMAVLPSHSEWKTGKDSEIDEEDLLVLGGKRLEREEGESSQQHSQSPPGTYCGADCSDLKLRRLPTAG